MNYFIYQIKKKCLKFLFGLALLFFFLSNMTESTNNPDETRPFYIEKVVDGDTIFVSQDKYTYKVRMIGINTPESVAPEKERNTPEGQIASDFTKSKLKKGTRIYLEFDLEKKDKYGRLLAYVWLTNKCDYMNYNDFCNYNFGAILLQNTYCDAVYFPPNQKYKKWYEQLDEQY